MTANVSAIKGDITKLQVDAILNSFDQIILACFDEETAKIYAELLPPHQ